VNNGFAIAAAAILLLLLQFDAAAGPFDGEWTGTAIPTAGKRCRHAVVSFTVDGQVVLGRAKVDDGDASSINGAVDENGAVGATVGFQPLRGQITGDEFEGTFRMLDCQWDAILTRKTGGDRNHAASSGMRSR
jgi:hypothetical protein